LNITCIAIIVAVVIVDGVAVVFGCCLVLSSGGVDMGDVVVVVRRCT